MSAMKTCFKCNQSKSKREFYRHPMMADGRLGKCKECAKADVKARYALTRPERSAYERERFQRPERKEQIRLCAIKRRRKHPEKSSAYGKLYWALKTGKIKRLPCEICGKRKSQAHHHDYFKPLDVRWLCFKHHREVHGQKVVSE